MELKTYVLEHKGRYLLGTACMLGAIGLDLLSPVLIRQIIDGVILDGKARLLMPLLFGLLGIGLGRAVLGYVKEFTFDWIGMAVTNRMRKDVFDHVQTLSVDFFHRHNTGELMTRIKDDVDKVSVSVGFIGMLAIEAAVHTVLVVGCMLRLSPLLTLVPLTLVPVIGVLAVRMEQKLGAVYDEISDETAAMNTVAEENLAGVRTVKAFTRENQEIEKFRGHNKRFYKLNMKQAELVAAYQPVISGLGKIMLLAVVIVGGLLVIRGDMTLGTLTAFSEYANNIIWPMEIIGWLSNDIGSAVASWKKIRGIMAETPMIREPEEAVELETVQGRLTFDHVGLSLDGKEILHDISFDLQPGKTLGIMGMTGAGKSMTVSLAQRFYDPTEGAVLLDGVDLRRLSLRQNVFLFSDTVNQNVKLGRKNALDDDAVKQALQQAEAGAFVRSLSGQEETLIGERGVGLSGGQKQRISIARAIAKGAPVLLLDDSTSALDMETEEQLQENLRHTGPMTKVIIGHRISAVRDADEILILRDGKILERGTHEELMKQKGEYYRTWCVQYGEEAGACL